MAHRSIDLLIRNHQWKPPRIQWPGAPLRHRFQRLVSDRGDGLLRRRHAVGLGEVGDDLPGGQSLRGERQDQLVQRARAAGVPGQDTGLEGAQPVPGDPHRDGADLGYHLLAAVAVAHVAARTRPAPADAASLLDQMLIHLGLQGRLHQVPGQLGQQPALAHQPQTATADLLGRQRGQLLQQLAGQTIGRHRHRLHVGTLSAPAGLGKRHAASHLDQAIRRRTHQVTPSGRSTPDS